MPADCRTCRHAFTSFDEYYSHCKDRIDPVLKERGMDLEKYRRRIENIIEQMSKAYPVVVICAKAQSPLAPVRVQNPEKPTQSFECEHYEPMEQGKTH